MPGPEPRRIFGYDATMVRKTWLDTQRLREEIALTAARMIAEDGLDYAAAKRKAARQITGENRITGDLLPDNDEIEAEVREYIAVFMSDSQPAELHRLRCTALAAMTALAAFRPYLSGAVLTGTATSHSDIYLQAFCDDAKEAAIALLNRGVDYEVSETRHFAGRGMVETLSFLWPGKHGEPPAGIHLTLYSLDDLRGALKPDGQGRIQRVDAAGLERLMAKSTDDLPI